MRLTIETRLDALPGLGSANVVLGLFAVAEALRLGARGEAYQAIQRAERELRGRKSWRLFWWREFLEPPELWPVSVRRSPESDLLVVSITKNAVLEEGPILTRLQFGSLEAEIEKLWDRIRRPFQRVVEAATEAARSETRRPFRPDSNLEETILETVEQSVEGNSRNRLAAITTVTAATGWLTDGLSQIEARNVIFKE